MRKTPRKKRSPFERLYYSTPGKECKILIVHGKLCLWGIVETSSQNLFFSSSRIFAKRVRKNSVIFRKNPTFAVIYNGSAFGFSSATLFLGALDYRKRGIHLFRQRPLIISRQASILRSHRFLPLQASKNLRLLRANRGLVPQSVVCGNASNYLSLRKFVKRVHG